MKQYEVKMTNGSVHTIGAASAADAIQTALEKAIGFKVFSCRSAPSSMGGVIHYEIPPHNPLFEAPEKHCKESTRTVGYEPKHADWMEDWLKKKQAKKKA
jgi:hypothetical protein